MERPTETVVQTARSAAEKLTGWKRRQFEAEVACTYCDGNPRRTESWFGWGRETVARGLDELRNDTHYEDNYGARGCPRTEDRYPELKLAIESLVEPESQADPKFQTTLAYTRVTAESVHAPLLELPLDTEVLAHVPTPRTIRNVLNRMGIRTRRVQKAKPQKNFPKPTRSSPTCT